MAGKSKKDKKKNRKPSAFAISGIHLLALEIEQVATEVYVTCPDRLDEVLNSLRGQIRSLRGICAGDAKRVDLEEDACPYPYIPCNGLCMMDCNGEPPPLSAAKTKASKKA